VYLTMKDMVPLVDLCDVLIKLELCTHMYWDIDEVGIVGKMI